MLGTSRILEIVILLGSHLSVALLVFAATIWFEPRRAWILSRMLVCQRKHDLIGDYKTVWTVDPPLSDGRTQFNELVSVDWASGNYISGKGASPDAGQYTFSGRITDSAITLIYRQKTKVRRDFPGVVMLRIKTASSYTGYWSQNYPAQSVIHHGTTTWTKIP